MILRHTKVSDHWSNTLQNIFKYTFSFEPHNPVMQVRNYWPHLICKETIFKSHLIVIKCVSNNSTQGVGTNFLTCQLFQIFQLPL